MNIALEKCEEHVNGIKKRSYGDAFIRGNNGMFYTLYNADRGGGEMGMVRIRG